MKFTDWVMALCLIVFLGFIYGYVEGSIVVKANKEEGK